jgi:hypothetical protein
MTPAVILSLASLWTFHPAKAEVSREVSRAAGWRIETWKDGFSGEVYCTLDKGDLAVRYGALVVDMGRKTDVTNGRFKVDNGPVRPLADGLLEVAAGHYPFFDDKTTSPIRGKAALPLVYVAGAQTVTVQPKTTRRAQTFQLSGLPEALTAARATGCAIPG